MTEQDSQLDGRRAVVTGGGAGIGAACARALAARGAHVVVADRDAQAAGAVAEQVGGESWVVDLDDTRALDDLRLEADILVNNAGIQVVRAIQDYDPEDFRRIQRIMVEAPFLLVRAALPHMYSRGWGRVVNLSSAHGLIASPYKSAYVTAKHALEGLSKVTALEGAAHGVTSTCVNPGYVRTGLVEQQIADQAQVHGLSEDQVLEQVMLTEQPVKRLVEVEEVASLVCWLVGPDSGMATGASYLLDGGWSAH